MFPHSKGSCPVNSGDISPDSFVLQVVQDWGRGDEGQVGQESSVQLFKPRGGVLPRGLVDIRRQIALHLAPHRFQYGNVEAAALLSSVGVVSLQPLSPSQQVGELDSSHQAALIIADHCVNWPSHLFKLLHLHQNRHLLLSLKPHQLPHLEGDSVVLGARGAGVNIDPHIGEAAQLLQLTTTILGCQNQVLKMLNLLNYIQVKNLSMLISY